MDLRIERLKIRNFMGIHEQDLDFGGKDAIIRGDNGTGKTTIKSAFSWLLFGKNTFGKTDFGIKPYDSNGDVIHNLETSVEAVFEIDGETKTLKRTLEEKWTRKRGAATATFTGNESGYFVDDIPKKKNEFAAVVSGIIGEDVFRIVTDPLFFNEQMDWKARRAMLMEICEPITDLEVIERNSELAPLLEILGNRSVDEHKAMIQNQMRQINSELGIIPVKIAEAERSRPDVDGIVIDAAKLMELEAKAEALQAKKIEIRNGGQIITMNAEKKALTAELNAVKVFDPHSTKEYQRLVDVMVEIDAAEAETRRLRKAVEYDEANLRDDKAEKMGLSKEWDKVFEMTFTDERCPACGQKYPANRIEKRKEEFNAERGKKLDWIETRLAAIKEVDREREARIELLTLHIEASTAKEAELKKEAEDLREAIETEKLAFNSRADEEKAHMRAKIADLSDEISKYGESIDAKVKAVEIEISAVQSEIQRINKDIAAADMAKRQNDRIEELKAQQITLANEYTAKERDLYLCEEFIKRKVDLLNEGINRKFGLARFKLFDVQVNGGIVETCEVTYDGVPYSDLNNAARINTGLDVINTICREKGIHAPIFTDNAESVVRLLPTESQQIQLVVDGSHKALVMEVKED